MIHVLQTNLNLIMLFPKPSIQLGSLVGLWMIWTTTAVIFELVWSNLHCFEYPMQFLVPFLLCARSIVQCFYPNKPCL